jgi:hypothetical protein
VKQWPESSNGLFHVKHRTVLPSNRISTHFLDIQASILADCLAPNFSLVP